MGLYAARKEFSGAGSAGSLFAAAGMKRGAETLLFGDRAVSRTQDSHIGALLFQFG